MPGKPLRECTVRHISRANVLAVLRPGHPVQSGLFSSQPAKPVSVAQSPHRIADHHGGQEPPEPVQ